MPSLTKERDTSYREWHRLQGQLRELPPSAKLVAMVLHFEGELGYHRLIEETLLHRTTARHALKQLKEAEIIDSRYCLTDARKQIYFIADEDT